jgi:hypothetical protein
LQAPLDQEGKTSDEWKESLFGIWLGFVQYIEDQQKDVVANQRRIIRRDGCKWFCRMVKLLVNLFFPASFAFNLMATLA